MIFTQVVFENDQQFLQFNRRVVGNSALEDVALNTTAQLIDSVSMSYRISLPGSQGSEALFSM
jgi:hypothetical protein